MHPNSMDLMKGFFSRFPPDESLKVLDVGSCLATGQTDTYRNLMRSERWEYTGLDLYDGNNVDIVASDPFVYPVGTESYDIVISGQCVEHNANPFRWAKELFRILKPGGFVCIIGPSKGKIHRSPPTTYDYWRVLPDGMRAILRDAGFQGILVEHVEDSPWGDCRGIGRKP